MKLLNHKRVRYGAGLLLVDGLLFASTDAANVPSFVVIIGFLLLVLTFYSLVYGFLSLGGVYGVPLRHKRQLAAYLSAVVGGLVALQSIGELSSRDVLVLLPLAIIGYVYSAYARTNRRNLGS